VEQGYGLLSSQSFIQQSLLAGKTIRFNDFVTINAISNTAIQWLQSHGTFLLYRQECFTGK